MTTSWIRLGSTLFFVSSTAVAAPERATAQAPAPPPPIVEGEAPPGPVPPAFPPAIPNLDYGARLRVVTRLQGARDPERLDDVSQMLDADLYMSGQIHRMLKWQASVTIAYSGAAGSSNVINAQPLDANLRVEPLPEFNVALGRMIVVADRFLTGGPWGTDEFYYHGFAGSTPVAALPKSGPNGRDLGVNLWGAPLSGHLKYYFGAYQLHDPALNPLLSARIQISLWSGEPRFYQPTTYFDTKDLLSIGAGAQYQADGSVQTVPPPAPNAMPVAPLVDDHTLFTGDIVFEKILGGAGTLSIYGAYTKFEGEYRRWEHYWLASVGYMLPKPIGIGKLRGTVRYQRGLDSSEGADASSILDVQLSYNVMAWFARFQLGYRRLEMYQRASQTAPASFVAGNQVYLGVTFADP